MAPEISLVRRRSLVDRSELLDPSTGCRLSYIHVSHRINRDGVTMGEVTGLMTWAPKRGENLPALVIEHMDLLIAPVHHVQVSLRLIRRESHSPISPTRIRQRIRARPDPDVANEVAHLVKHLHSVPLAITDIDQPFVAQRDAVHDLGECAWRTLFYLLLGSLSTPLTQEVSLAVKNSNTPVTVSVGDVEITVLRIHRNGGGSV